MGNVWGFRMATHGGGGPGNNQDRLVRLEEAMGFAEHTLGQLSSEIAELNRRLAEAQARIDRLERRVEKVAQSPESSDGEAGS